MATITLSARFTGGEVYINTPIEDLRKNLTVTESVGNLGPIIIYNYTLSGSLYDYDSENRATLTIMSGTRTCTVKVKVKLLDDKYRKTLYSKRIDNHTRITVTSKKTGVAIVLLETDADNPDYFAGDLYRNEDDEFKAGTILAGIPIKQAVDDSLDSLTFIVQETDTKALYKPFDVVNFTVRSKLPSISETNITYEVNEYEMCVLSDNAKTLSPMERTYKHTVTCIELTKILEKCKIFNLNLTNPNDTLLRQMEKAVVNAEPLVDGRQCRYFITDELKTLLNDKPGEDFYFGNTDLRTVLDGILAPCNVRAEVKHIEFAEGNISRIELGYRSLSQVEEVEPVWDEDHAGAIVYEELSNYAQDYAGKIVARGYNTQLDEPLMFSDRFKTSSATLTDSNAQAFFPFPIADKGISKFSVQCSVNIGISYYTDDSGAYPESEIIPKIIPVDITEYLILSEQYELLSEEQHKNYLPYNIGSDSLGVGDTKKTYLRWTASKLENFVKEKITNAAREYVQNNQEWFKNYINTRTTNTVKAGTKIGFNKADYTDQKWTDWSFTASFYPQVNTVAELSKPGVYDKDELLLGIMDNQSENNLDVTRHGQRLESLVKRTGNNEYYIDVTANYFSRLLPLMSKIKMPADKTGYSDGDYVIYKRECGCYDMFTKCRYYLSKDFNAIQKVAGVNRTKHLYDIPLESDECPIVIKKRLVFSYTKPQEILNDKLINIALNTISESNAQSNNKIGYLLFRTKNSDTLEVFPSDNAKCYAVACAAYGQANSLNITASPLDNYSVGYSSDGGYELDIWGSGGLKMTYNRYVSKDNLFAGECDAFEINLGAEPIDVSLFSLPVIYLPEPNYSNDNRIVPLCTNNVTINYHKDRTQKPVFLYSLECVPAEKDYGKLIIGSAFSRYNNLVCSNKNNKIILKISNNKKISVGQEVLSADYAGYERPLSIEVIKNYIKNVTPFNISQNGSWAIVNEKNEILLGGNKTFNYIYAYLEDF